MFRKAPTLFVDAITAELPDGRWCATATIWDSDLPPRLVHSITLGDESFERENLAEATAISRAADWIQEEFPVSTILARKDRAAEEGQPDVAFSRSGISALGKCTAVLKTHVPEDTDFGFKGLAAQAGCTPSELLRDLVCLAVHEQTFGELTADTRKKLLKTAGPEKGLLARVFGPSK